MHEELMEPTPGPRDFMTIYMDHHYLRGQILIAQAQAVGVSKMELATMAAEDCAGLEFKLNLLKEEQNGTRR